MIKRIFVSLISVLMLISVFPFFVSSEDDPRLTMKGNNYNTQEYASANFGLRVASKLIDLGDRYMVVQADTRDDVYVLYYTYDYKYIESFKLEEGLLPIYGAFHASENAYFLITGQENSSEDNSKEVIRISKYDKNWNYINSVSLYGANTIEPFCGGGTRCADLGDYLIIKSSHKMYKANDGLNHQANMTISVNKNNMTIAYSNYKVSTDYGAYVSHSMNQHVINDNDYIITLAHGDGYPRGIILLDEKINKNTGTKSEQARRANILNIYGASGYNQTNASIGGVAASNNNYLVAFESTEQTSSMTFPRNEYLAVVNKNSFAVNKIRLTNNTDNNLEDHLLRLSTPHIVKINNNDFMILYTSNTDYNGGTRHALYKQTIHYLRVDGNGNIIYPERTFTGTLSDCVPIVKNNKVIWYIQQGYYIDFYEIDLSTNNASFNIGSDVNPVYATDIILSKDNIKMAKTDSDVTIVAQVLPENVSDKRYSIEIEDESVLGFYVENFNFYFTPLKEGDTKIIFRSYDGKVSKEVPVSVYNSRYKVSYYNGIRETTVQSLPNENISIWFYPVTTNIIFVRWEGLDDVEFLDGYDTTSVNTKFVMPKRNVNPVAIYNILVTDIELTSKEVSIEIGDTYTPEFKVNPEDATNKNVTFTSSDSSIASVTSDGVIKGLKGGTATITIASEDGNCTRTLKVNVRRQVTSINVPESMIIVAGDIVEVPVEVIPSDATNKNLTLKTDDFNIASVTSNNKIYARKDGITYLTVTSVSNPEITARIKLDVKKGITSAGFTDSNDLIVDINDTKQLNVTITPEDAYNKNIIWEYDSSYLDIEGLTVIPKKVGNCVVKGTTQNKNYYLGSKNVRIINKVKSINFANNEISVPIGRFFLSNLNYTISPSKATIKDVTLESSDNSVVEVSKYDYSYLTAKKEGRAVITVKSTDGYNASNTIIVNVYKPLNYIYFNDYTYVVEKGKTKATVLTLYPEDATNKEIIYKSNNESIATIDANGVIKGIKPGETTIEARAKDSDNVTATARVRVESHVTKVQLDKYSMELEIGQEGRIVATALPTDAQNRDIYWESDNSNVYVYDGVVRGYATGTAKIKAYTYNGKSAVCVVTIKKQSQVESVSLNHNNLQMNVGDSVSLVATTYPSHISTYLQWSSSNYDVAYVDGNGVITAYKQGTATITVTTNNGKTSECHVTVNAKQDNPVGGNPQLMLCGFNTSVAWESKNGKMYWYEKVKDKFVKQAVPGDPKNIWDEVYGVERGREIYDPCSDGWYWLDSIYDGAKAEGKEVWIPYIYQDEANWDSNTKYSLSLDSDSGLEEYIYNAMKSKSGKWVRYDYNGKMAKGWYKVEGNEALVYPDQIGNIYYYDTKTGAMVKGYATIDGYTYYFDEISGALR